MNHWKVDSKGYIVRCESKHCGVALFPHEDKLCKKCEEKAIPVVVEKNLRLQKPALVNAELAKINEVLACLHTYVDKGEINSDTKVSELVGCLTRRLIAISNSLSSYIGT